MSDTRHFIWFDGEKGGAFGVDPATWRYVYRTAEGREYQYSAESYKNTVIPNLLAAHPDGIITDFDFAAEYIKLKPNARIWADFETNDDHFQKLRKLWGYDFAFLLAVKVLERFTARGTRPHRYRIHNLDPAKGRIEPDENQAEHWERAALLETIKTQDEKIKALEQQLSHEKQVAKHLEELQRRLLVAAE